MPPYVKAIDRARRARLCRRTNAAPDLVMHFTRPSERERTSGEALLRLGRRPCALNQPDGSRRPRIVILRERQQRQVRKMPGKFSSARKIGGEYRNAKRARLERRPRQSFPERRQDHESRARHPRDRILDFANELDTIRQTRVGRRASNLLPVVSNFPP